MRMASGSTALRQIHDLAEPVENAVLQRSELGFVELACFDQIECCSASFEQKGVVAGQVCDAQRQ